MAVAATVDRIKESQNLHTKHSLWFLYRRIRLYVEWIHSRRIFLYFASHSRPRTAFSVFIFSFFLSNFFLSLLRLIFFSYWKIFKPLCYWLMLSLPVCGVWKRKEENWNKIEFVDTAASDAAAVVAVAATYDDDCVIFPCFHIFFLCQMRTYGCFCVCVGARSLQINGIEFHLK